MGNNDKTEEIFTETYNENHWGGEESVSGPGSDTFQTRILIKALPDLLKELNISSMLDVPCGDFNWMQNIDLTNLDYIGGDIVKSLVQSNIDKYGNGRVKFQYLNLLKDQLQKVDLILCRDCLVHFSLADIALALKNIYNSQSKYLLTTTFTDANIRSGAGFNDNGDINTGEWRPLNLQRAPFMLPEPPMIINEGCTEGGGICKDKSLGLWRVADLKKAFSAGSVWQ